MDKLVDTLVEVLALALSMGEAFLPDAASYDDLFYKIFEFGDSLTKFRDAYELTKRPSSASMNILINVSSHYTRLLEEQKGKGNKHMSPKEIRKIIRQGYETLSIEAKEGLDRGEKYREASHKALLKKVTRVAVKDLRNLLAAS